MVGVGVGSWKVLMMSAHYVGKKRWRGDGEKEDGRRWEKGVIWNWVFTMLVLDFLVPGGKVGFGGGWWNGGGGSNGCEMD